MSAPTPPTYMCAWDDSDWTYYVLDLGTPEESVLEVDEPEVLLWERVWMRPIRASDIDPDDRPEELDDALTRGSDGKFESVWCWEECVEGASGAVAYYGVRYKPASVSGGTG